MAMSAASASAFRPGGEDLSTLPAELRHIAWREETAFDALMYKRLEMALPIGEATVVVPVGFFWEDSTVVLGLPAEIVPWMPCVLVPLADPVSGEPAADATVPLRSSVPGMCKACAARCMARRQWWACVVRRRAVGAARRAQRRARPGVCAPCMQ